MSQCPKCMHSAKTVLDDVEIACKRVVHDAPDRADCSVTNDMWRRWKGENREEGKLIAQLEGTAEPEAPPAEAEPETLGEPSATEPSENTDGEERLKTQESGSSTNGKTKNPAKE
jgi:hypothetical protein